MDYSLTPEQELLRDSARSLLLAECPASLVRVHAEDTAAIKPLFDRHLREWVALGEGSLVDLALFGEEAGAVLLPGPLFATAVLFAPVLAAADHALAGAAGTGEVTGTVAWADASGIWSADGSAAGATRHFVLEVDAVDWLAIVGPGPSVAVLPSGDVSYRAVETLDTTRRVFEVDVPTDADWAPVGGEELTRILQRATVALAAELIGTSRWLNDAMVSYSREREQFGRPIGSFQGLQFGIVDAGLDHERAAAATYYAAMAVDADDGDRHRAVHVAKAAAGTAARHAARRGLQVHGGIGYTWEHDLHLYLRRAYASDDLLGDAAWHHDRLADLLFDH